MILIVSGSYVFFNNNDNFILKTIGKKINVEPQKMYSIYDHTALKLSSKNDYIIVVYIDYQGCTECNLQLDKWKVYLEKLKSKSNKQISLYFIIDPSAEEKVTYIINSYHSRFPIYIDSSNIFKESNNLPTEKAYQTFLLDKDHKIIIVGNPIVNSKIENLYNKVFGESYVHEPKTIASIDRVKINLRKINIGKNARAYFIIQNKGQENLYIKKIQTSCSCIKVSYKKAIVAPGKNMKVYITYTPKEIVDFWETVRIEANAQLPDVEIQGKFKLIKNEKEK